MFVENIVNKLRLWYEGNNKIPGGECHRCKNGVKEETKRFRCIHSICGSGMDPGGCADELQCFQCTCAVVFLLEDQSRWSWHHEVMSWGSLMLLREGTIKGEHNWTLGLSSGSSGTKHLGLIMSHRPSASAVLVPLMEKCIPRMECVTCLSICMYPDLSGDFQFSVTVVIWQWPGRSLPTSPWTWYWVKHRSQPSVADCKGRINC